MFARILDARVLFCIKLTMLVILVLTLLPAFGEVAVPTAVQLVVPIDVVALTSTIFTGIAAIGGIFVSIFLPILAGRQKRTEAATVQAALEIAKAQLALKETNLEIAKAQLELSKVKDNVVLIERNTNSMTSTIKELASKAGVDIGRAEEKLKGEETAATLAEGQRQGMEKERSAVAAQGASGVAPSATPANTDAAMQAATVAATAAAAIAAPAAAAIAAPPAAAIAAPPAADIAAPPVVKAVVPPAVEEAVKAAFESERIKEKK